MYITVGAAKTSKQVKIVFYCYADKATFFFFSYVPSRQDILYCRKKTTAVSEFKLDIENVPFIFVDVVSGRSNIFLNYKE